MKKLKGYYDLLLALNEKIDSDFIVKSLHEETNNIIDIDTYLLNQFQIYLKHYLSSISDVKNKLKTLNKLLEQISTAQLSEQVLLQINDQETASASPFVNDIRLTDHYLFTNDQEQELIQYLHAEMKTCEQIVFIYPFIAKSMINKLLLAFQAAAEKNIPIYIITTTFDNQALFVNLYELEKLIYKFHNIKIRIEDNTEQRSERIHIKAAIFHRSNGFSSALIGSSNLTSAGMLWGREWNIKISEFSNKSLYKKIWTQYLKLWEDQLLDFNDNEIRKQLFNKIVLQTDKNNDNQCKINHNNYFLYDFQIKICEKLQYRRSINKNKHLIIMATGTGKTIVSAFDYLQQIKNYQGKAPRLLFLAHQKEIVFQALQTFRSVLLKPHFGIYLTRATVVQEASHVFATIQTIYRQLEQFSPQQFDVIIFDEAHHMAANTFAKVFNYFQPKEVIGLTATPEREDNKNILEFFDHEFAHEMRLWDAINERLLAKFDYFCIDDVNSDLTGVDLNNDKKVFKRLNTVSRNELLFSVIKNYIGYYHQPLALIFCINTEHAEIVANFLHSKGLKSAYFTNKLGNKRAKVFNDFKKRQINYLCVVNMFNEGVDVPEIDNIILLRPTNSRTVYLQQLGRGLRKTKDKNKAAIYDLIANIDAKYDVTIGIKNLYQQTSKNIRNDSFFDQGFQLPAGCTISLEAKSKEIILQNLQNWYQAPNRITTEVIKYYEQYQEIGLIRLLSDYQLSLVEFYNYLDNFYLLVGQKLKAANKKQNLTNRNKNILKQFLFLNNFNIIKYFYCRLKADVNLAIDYHYDNLLICSLFYEVTSITIFHRFFNNANIELIPYFIANHSLIVSELLLILKYKLDNEILITDLPLNNNFPLLVIKTTFTVRQALCAINRVNFIKQIGPLKIIAFQAGYLTFEHNKSVVFADLGGLTYGKHTRYDQEEKLFYWSIPETKNTNSKLVKDLQDQSIMKFLFLNNTLNLNYPKLKLKLYNFVGFGKYLETFIEKYVTIKFNIE